MSLTSAVAVVVTLYILCGPCNYWWRRYHALLSAPHGIIRAECVSHFCIHSIRIISWQLFNFNSVSSVAYMFLHSVSQSCSGLHVDTVPCSVEIGLLFVVAIATWVLYIQ